MTSLPTALVTGAAGFLGAHVVRALRAQGRVHVVGLDDLSGGDRGNLPADVPLVVGSVTDGAIVAEVFQRFAVRHLYHLAAYAAEGLSHHIRAFNYTNNVVGSMHLINAAVRHGCESFVFASSIAVYGALPPPMREDQRPEPEDPYGIAKYAVELDLRAAAKYFGLRHVIFRPHNVYGEYQNVGDPYRNVVGIFMRQILLGQPLSVFGDGEQVRAFSYVGDVAPTIALSPWVSAAANQTFNVGADTPYTVNALARATAEVMGAPDHPIVHLPPRDEVRVAYADHSKLYRVFGRPPVTPLRDGLARMAQWVREVGLREATRFTDLEVVDRLPPSWRALL